MVLFQPSAAEVHAQAGRWFEDQEIYEWFAKNLHRVREPSLRHYVRARELKAAGMDWTEVLATEAENPQRSHTTRAGLRAAVDTGFDTNERSLKSKSEKKPRRAA